MSTKWGARRTPLNTAEDFFFSGELLILKCTLNQPLDV
jgi:hypothetical protein